MYLVPVSIKKSSIDGDGVFAESNISESTIVWKYTDGHDIKMTREVFNSLDADRKKKLQRIAYLSPTTDLWVMPPDNDPACFTNHSLNTFNTSVVVDKSVSDEPFFVANRDISTGEEITNNYLEFDENSTTDKFKWLKP
jgi:uncharacterized protein